MAARVITDPTQIDPAWLQQVLHRRGALLAGSVRDVAMEVSGSTTAHLVKLTLHYDDAAAGLLPTKLLLKLCAPAAGTFGASEVDYYACDYVGLADAPIPRCYDAHYSAVQQRYHILVDDLSDQYDNSWKTVPTHAYGQRLAHAFAILHNHYWGRERLAATGHALPTTAVLERYLAHIRPGLAPMLRELDGQVDAAWLTALPDIFDHHPHLMAERLRGADGFALLHGDPNPGNILIPRVGQGRAYLIDRQPFDWSLTTWLGVSDVAYMMVHWWNTAERRALEWSVLQQYYARLHVAQGAGYSWEQLVYDYKLCAVQSIYVAVAWCVDDAERVNMRWVWLPQLKRAMAAFFDLACAAQWR